MDMMRRYKKIMNSNEYKNAFKKFLFFNLYDKNLYKEKYKNPHEVYEDQMIHKYQVNNEDNCKDENDNCNNIKNEGKSVNEQNKLKFAYMNLFHKNDFNLFEKSQNIPNIKKIFKDDTPLNQK